MPGPDGPDSAKMPFAPRVFMPGPDGPDSAKIPFARRIGVGNVGDQKG